jgi:hypothetical protein
MTEQTKGQIDPEAFRGLGSRAASERGRRERERETALWRSHLHRSYEDDQPVGEARVRAVLGPEAQVIGNGGAGAWEKLAARAHQAQNVRPSGDIDYSDEAFPGFDPDDLQNEIQRLGTPDARSVDRFGRR